MSESDKKTFKQGRPYVVGVVALIIAVVAGGKTNEQAFDTAEEFVKEFERRNDCLSG